MRHHAPNVAMSGRWATTACSAATPPTLGDVDRLLDGRQGGDGVHRPALQRRPRRPRWAAARLSAGAASRTTPWPDDQWEAFVRGWSSNLLSSVDGALYICMSTKEWPLVSQRPRRGRRSLVRHDHLGQGPLRPGPRRLPAAVRADLVRLARRRRALLVRRPRPGRRLDDRRGPPRLRPASDDEAAGLWSSAPSRTAPRPATWSSTCSSAPAAR